MCLKAGATEYVLKEFRSLWDLYLLTCFLSVSFTLFLFPCRYNKASKMKCYSMYPNISPEADEYQVLRIAKERGISEDFVRESIKECTRGRFMGFWGEPGVNLLKVNLILDGLIESE